MTDRTTVTSWAVPKPSCSPTGMHRFQIWRHGIELLLSASLRAVDRRNAEALRHPGNASPGAAMAGIVDRDLTEVNP